jgi:hypothetical protein
VNLTLPHNLADHTTANACVYTGYGLDGGWDCARSSSTGNTVLRSFNIQTGLDWSAGYKAGPTAVTLKSFSGGSPASSWGWAAMLAVMPFFFGGIWLVSRKLSTTD